MEKNMTGQIVAMNWYNEFSCPGGDCGLTCCTTTWRILLKDEEIEMYKSLDNDYKDKILAAIDEEKKCFCGGDDKKCAMLNEDGYCNIVLNVGEEYLSTTCKKFPRMSRKFVFLEEAYVEISCPLVAEMLFKPDSIFFTVGDLKFKEKDLATVNANLILDLYSLRTSLIDVLQKYPCEHLYGKTFILSKVLLESYTRNNDHGFNTSDVETLKNTFLSPEVVEKTFAMCASLSDNFAAKAQYLYKTLIDSEALSILTYALTGSNDQYPFIETRINEWLKDGESFGIDFLNYIKLLRKNYPSFVENYYIYSLFSKWLPKQDELFGVKTASNFMGLFYIHLSAMAVLKENGELNKKDFSVIVASIARFCERNKEFCDRAGNFFLKKCIEDPMYFIMTTIG